MTPRHTLAVHQCGDCRQPQKYNYCSTAMLDRCPGWYCPFRLRLANRRALILRGTGKRSPNRTSSGWSQDWRKYWGPECILDAQAPPPRTNHPDKTPADWSSLWLSTPAEESPDCSL